MDRRVWRATVHAELDMTEVTERMHTRDVHLSDKTVSRMEPRALAHQYYFSTGRATGT